MEREKLQNNSEQYPYILVDRDSIHFMTPRTINPMTYGQIVCEEEYTPNIFMKAQLLFNHYANKIKDLLCR